ncbi:uncharacterized protein LOC131951135 [Physella acuta]|uniref:uncharacterized protein LOC131951135 n=1 Tax=Physella acuta TaxID=109671 RepID=UPI0027DD2F9E|nr:uncharacterized protein LOC131951135 [Physella acuta]
MKTILLLLAVVAVAQAGVTLTLSSDDIEAFLKAHNDVRNALGIPSLTWDTKLADFAKDWISKCVFEHSYCDYGENLFGTGSTTKNATELAYSSASAWKSEVAYVDPDWKCFGASFRYVCSHYSQENMLNETQEISLERHGKTSLVRHRKTSLGRQNMISETQVNIISGT